MGNSSNLRLDLTVAAVVAERDRFLLVEEHAGGRIVLNQPAGHVEPGESLREAVIRETLEETAWHFEPEAIIGIYLWSPGHGEPSFLRVAYTGRCSHHERNRALDHGIIRNVWLTRDQLQQQAARLRSPMVLRAVDDFISGQRHQCDLVSELAMPELARRAAIL
ncbi:MAG: NUDIX hydrolase [Chromatiales bacterium]|nr:NUDIX hydrolase [Chromatiales bacterium]